MSDINYALLGGGDVGAPPDGLHTAYLAVAKLLTELQGGSKLVTEWQVSNGSAPYYWSTWHGFAPNRMAVTQEFLDGLGVDRKTITDDAAFEAALAQVQGVTYTVRTSAWSGGTNTFIEDVAVPASSGYTGALTGANQSPPSQQQSDIPADTTGLPEPTPAGAYQLPDADDVPF